MVIPRPLARDIKSKAAFAIPVPTDKSVSFFLEDYEGQAHFSRDTSYRNFESNRQGDQRQKERNQGERDQRNQDRRNTRNNQNEYSKKPHKKKFV